MPSVAIVKGFDRYDNITRALDLLGSEAMCGITHLLKPNFVSTENQLASTHREAARAVLDFLHKHSENPVIIAVLKGLPFMILMMGSETSASRTL